ncbi:MAG: hypothetical protein ABI569_10025 [Casimicrobiaceae bacterium]
MRLTHTAIALAVGALVSGPACAQGTAATVQRDVNQQQRIEQGLQSGQLTTGEAAKLEKQETKVETMQKNALKDGTLSPAEKARLTKAQNATSASIAAQKHDAQVGNPNSASSKRMQADVQRNVNQQARIAQGVKSGELTNTEVAKLERGQSHVTGKEARAGANGRVGAAEQANIQAAENRQSAHVYGKKHNATIKQ